jgi:hypothetical protein
MVKPPASGFCGMAVDKVPGLRTAPVREERSIAIGQLGPRLGPAHRCRGRRTRDLPLLTG